MSSPMQGFERDTLAAVLNSKRVWLTHIVANALLVIAFFYWTRIPDETGWQVALSVVAALLIVFVTLWLHTATFVYFKRTSERQWGASLRSALPRVPAFFLWTVIFGLVLWGIGGLWDYSDQAGGYIRHLLPQATRRAITPPSSFSAVHWFIWFLNFFLFPILVLPVGAQAATRGFRGFVSRAAFRPVREVRYWLAYLVCFLIGAYLPYRLAWMLPEKPSALSAQSWSMVLRLGFGYLLLVTAWVVLCAAIMRAIDEDDLDAAETKPALIFNSGAAIAITHQALLMLRDWRVVCLQLASAAVVTATADLSSFGEKNWQIGLGTTGVVLLLLVFLWLQAGTLVYAAEPDPQRFRTAGNRGSHTNDVVTKLQFHGQRCLRVLSRA